ncbi:MAG: hypothetical protein HY815_03800 [Candidatus Riflebacteria bacterium]|nr:hypothetical protein [Candidatus Riflebacteria bacterium]
MLALAACALLGEPILAGDPPADKIVAGSPAPVPDLPGRPATGLTTGSSSRAIEAAPSPIQEVADPSERSDPGSMGCVGCHTGVSDMHAQKKVGCVDCHGGDASQVVVPGSRPDSRPYLEVKRRAHVPARFPEAWPTSANPQRTYTLLEKESKEFVRFINPGDLRVAQQTCGTSRCHADESGNVGHSMMTHGAMLWGAALYNNGSIPLKNPVFGESYSPDGKPRRLSTVPPPLAEETWTKGVLPFLDPLPRWEITQPGNILRVFERGGKRKLEVGLPDPNEDPGRPDKGLSPRGLGTANRTDPVFLGLQKTRLLDPILSMLGTNDHPGDYRSSGCSACHVLYANDRDPVHSGYLARYGNLGRSATADPTIPKNESGHPVKHRFTNAIPSSQCIVCHMHPGTNVVNSYLGYIWWDNETDGELMYPRQQHYPTPDEVDRMLDSNPESASLKGFWSDPDFLNRLTDLNPKLKHTQFADFHGHGWVYRAVYKKDRQGMLLDAEGRRITEQPLKDAGGNICKGADGKPLLDQKAKPVADISRDLWKKAVHLKDIHLEKGMHCVDCHFSVDVHGNGKLYGETRNAVEIACHDCHGTHDRRTSLLTSGPAAPPGGTNLVGSRTPFGSKRFEWVGDELKQRSQVTESLEWTVVQVADTVDPRSRFYNEKARLAKTLQKDGHTWGDAATPEAKLAHANSRMTCFACHSSWMTSCFGCHLPMKANRRKPSLHNEGVQSRNWTSYNYQVVRDDIYQLGIDGTVTGNRIAPVRSSSAVVVSSQNQNREWIYSQQQTVSAEGFSGQAFNTHVPHTVRATETKGCTDCHVSMDNDNNAIMAQLLLQGTNFVNFLGRYIYVGEGTHGFEAVVATERDEPQAVIGSHLHWLAFPDPHARHVRARGELTEAYWHGGADVRSLQLRGEYLYTANGERGFEVFDVAQVDHKGFSERLVSAPVSPWGQRTHVRTRYATAVALPSTLAVDPTRPHRPENQEQPVHPVYGYAYVTDRYEGLVVIGVATLLDGNPMNNFLGRAVTFNPAGALDGARGITIAGIHAYISTPKGLVIVSLDDPLHPRVVAQVGRPILCGPRTVAIQFRYAYVCDEQGVKVLDVTFPDHPRAVAGGSIPLAHGPHDIYLARTYAYVAAGREGLIILDIEKPEEPKLSQVYTAEGRIVDARAVRVGSTNISLFAYVADAQTGLHVVQLTDPERTAGHLGFSPRPSPRWIARYKTRGPAIALSKGLDRDRAVDESGNQIAVFGRVGARPFNKAEMERLYLRGDTVFRVSNSPTEPPQPNRGVSGRVAGPQHPAGPGKTILRLRPE